MSTNAVLSWRSKFLDAGRQALEDKISGPGKGAGTAEERRLRVEANQLKLALAEATVQLRIWQKGAEYVYQVPSSAERTDFKIKLRHVLDARQQTLPGACARVCR